MIKCDHCHLEFSKDVMIEDNGHYFCCNGCQGVFHLLNEQGLDSFYEKAKDVKLTPPTKQFEDSKNFNTPAFYEKFVRYDDDGFAKVSLVIEGIHCSACVWLNEKALLNMEGIVEANINYTNNKATIVWDDDIVKLSDIVDMIRAIGYDAFPYDPKIQEEKANKQRKDYYVRMAVAIFGSMNVMWIAVAQYAGYFSGIKKDVQFILNLAEWALSTPVLFFSGWVFFRGAYYAVKTKQANMDLLVATGALLTYIYSIYITFTQKGEAYFDSVTMIITFVLIGKFLEVLSKKNIADAIDIMGKDIPLEVKIKKENSIENVKLKDVKVGDICVVNAGEKVLFDGVVLKGSGNFDESSLTGESRAVFKSNGDKVVSGSVSIDADIEFKVLKDFEHSTLSNLTNLLQDAINKKPKIQQLANKISEYFSIVILSFSVLTFFVWYFYISADFERAFMVAISVIIIACPCALALATPIATLVGLGVASKRGVLFKEAAQLETMSKTDVLLLDKTGTITYGKPKVVNETIYKDFDRVLLYSMVKNSNHPVSKAIADYLKENDEVLFDKYKQHSALGIEAYKDGIRYLGGNKKLLESFGIECKYHSGKSVFYFGIDNEPVAVFEIEDEIKKDAKDIIAKIKKMGIKPVMITGDKKEAALKVAQEVGIDECYYELLPEHKMVFVEDLHKKSKVVVMVGDGINDILALSEADIGIAMGSGSDIAIEVGDVVLLDDSLKSLKDAFVLSRKTYSLIKQNLFISLVYNAITIPLAMAGYIIPLIAAVSMSFSSLLVVLNSIRLKKLGLRF